MATVKYSKPINPDDDQRTHEEYWQMSEEEAESIENSQIESAMRKIGGPTFMVNDKGQELKTYNTETHVVISKDDPILKGTKH
jgi:hypothetical protein